MLTVKGKGGTLAKPVHSAVAIVVADGAVSVAPATSSRLAKALWGTYAAHVNNMLSGVNTPFARKLEVQGIGYKVDLQGKTLVLYVGYSHPVRMDVPEGLAAKVEKNVITIEDPIEYHLAGISQIQVSNKKGLTFAAGLRSLLRQDPDIMMVGEVRDEETARIAIQAALTGHLVLSTLHTNDSAGAVTRMLDIGIEPYLVASSLIGVIAQRLIRVICKECKVAIDPTPDDLALMQEVKMKVSDLPGGKLMKGRGCDACFNTGYTGRTAIYEILKITDEVREHVVNRASASLIKQAALRGGLITLRGDGLAKVKAGVSTLEEVLRVTQLDME